MIVQIRGTSGSGKSTVVRTAMEHLEWSSHHIPGRKKPLYYRSTSGRVIVLGHYESPCGGCDTIGSAAEVYKVVMELGTKLAAPLIVCEGLLLSEDVKWTSQLPSVHCVFLTTPLETCLKQIGQRRAAVGNEKPLNVKNTSNRVATIERARLRLIDEGVTCVRMSQEQATNWLAAYMVKVEWRGI